MDPGDQLVSKIYSLVELQRECARKFLRLADQLEEADEDDRKRSLWISGATTLTSVLFPPAALLAAGAGLALDVGLGVSSASDAKDAMNEAERMAERINHLGKEVQNLMESLGEDNSGNLMVRALARRNGLELPDGVDFPIMNTALNMVNFSQMIKVTGTLIALSASVGSILGLCLARKTGEKVAKSAMSKVASGAAVAGGAALLFSLAASQIPVENKPAKNLRDKAGDIRTAADEVEGKLRDIERQLEKLARVKRAIETSHRSKSQEEEIFNYVLQRCEDEDVRQWLVQHKNYITLFKLVDLFSYLKRKMDKEEKKVSRGGEVDLVFVAHGAIQPHMIPARSLLLPSIIDVLLYSPWNCLINANVVYGIASGSIRPQDREFYYRFTGERYGFFNLPNCWNSMRGSKLPLIPNILISSLGDPCNDAAFKDYITLVERHGRPGKYIVICYINPFIDQVPFLVVLFVLSVVLSLCQYRARVHLAACLGRTEPDHLDWNQGLEAYLQQQYALTHDNILMSIPEYTLSIRDRGLFNFFRSVFG